MAIAGGGLGGRYLTINKKNWLTTYNSQVNPTIMKAYSEHKARFSSHNGSMAPFEFNHARMQDRNDAADQKLVSVIFKLLIFSLGVLLSFLYFSYVTLESL